jgi:hypothetical protein
MIHRVHKMAKREVDDVYLHLGRYLVYSVILSKDPLAPEAIMFRLGGSNGQIQRRRG